VTAELIFFGTFQFKKPSHDQPTPTKYKNDRFVATYCVYCIEANHFKKANAILHDCFSENPAGCGVPSTDLATQGP
jgi:hypothetical protein